MTEDIGNAKKTEWVLNAKTENVDTYTWQKSSKTELNFNAEDFEIMVTTNRTARSVLKENKMNVNKGEHDTILRYQDAFDFSEFSESFIGLKVSEFYVSERGMNLMGIYLDFRLDQDDFELFSGKWLDWNDNAILVAFIDYYLCEKNKRDKYSLRLEKIEQVFASVSKIVNNATSLQDLFDKINHRLDVGLTTEKIVKNFATSLDLDLDELLD
jgi:hypothetical protein